MRDRQILRAVTEASWAMRPESLAVVLDLITRHAAGHRFTDDEIQARIGATPARRQSTLAGAVAVLPLFGVLVPRAGLMTQMSGATSVQQFGEDLRHAVADSQVDAILIDIDSPGGMTDLVTEVAALIRQAREVKPIMAIANTDAASAAYWIGAQAGELVVTPSGLVGSVGVYAAHEDISAMQEMEGRVTTLISAGKFKVETSPFAPLSDEARAAIQARVDDAYSMFVRDVALGRGVSESAVRTGFGQGRVVTAQDALAQGMVDRVATFDETLERLARGPAARQAERAGTGAWSSTTPLTGVSVTGSPPGQPITIEYPQAAESGLSFAREAEALRASAARLTERTASLAEVERGHLTVAKREHLTACTEELRQSVEALEGLLADTDPKKRSAAALREHARFERQRANL